MNAHRKRLRELGLGIGSMPCGPVNAITDVSGVMVGHRTLITDSPDIVRSGVTAILPHNDNIYDNPVFGGLHVLNGCGEMTGMAWLDEFGTVCCPIGLTGTYSVGAVHEGQIRAEIAYGPENDFKLPLVAETDDSRLSDGNSFAVRPEHFQEALAAASSGPVGEGNVGGGTGMNCHEFKGGIGTSSRIAKGQAGTYTVGVLVQANYGRRSRLRLDGLPVGSLLPVSEYPAPWEKERVAGSIIIIVATDAPLLPHQCKRLAQRACLGVGRVGGVGESPSGDIALAFSTATRLDINDLRTPHTVQMLPDNSLTLLYDAVIEATEEAIWNSLCMAESMQGKEGRFSHAIPLDALLNAVEILRNGAGFKQDVVPQQEN